jgi:ribosomal RNA assembly protein
MEHILIPEKRAGLLKEKVLLDLSKKLRCKITLTNGNEVMIEGESYDEYNAKNVLQAFGRGFDLDSAYKLLIEDYFFEQINIKDVFHTKDQLERVKARIIGTEGKTKLYIESLSGVKLAIFGGTISMIGRIEEIQVAKTGIKVLIEGGMHKTAYRIMENEQKKIRSEEYGKHYNSG